MIILGNIMLFQSNQSKFHNKQIIGVRTTENKGKMQEEEKKNGLFEQEELRNVPKLSQQEENLIYQTIYQLPLSNDPAQGFDSIDFNQNYSFKSPEKKGRRENKKKKVHEIKTRESEFNERVFQFSDEISNRRADDEDGGSQKGENKEQFDPSAEPMRKPRWKKAKKQQEIYSKNSYQQLSTYIESYLKQRRQVEHGLYVELKKKSKKGLQGVLRKGELSQIFMQMFDLMEEMESKIEASKASRRQKAMNINLLKLVRKKFEQGKYNNTEQQCYDTLP